MRGASANLPSSRLQRGRLPPSTKKPSSPPRAGRTKKTAFSAKLLASALQSLGEGVIIARARWHKAGFRIAFANDHFCTLTGHSSRALLGKSLGSLHLDKGEITRQRRWFRASPSAQAYAGEGALVRRDGSSLFAAWIFSALVDSKGKVTHVVASYRDLTEKRQLQDALIQAQRLDAVGKLAGGIADDFNNLLSVINGYSEILADRLATDQQTRHDLSEIHHAGQKASALTRQLLAFSRRQSIDPRVLHLNELILGHADLLSHLVKPLSTLSFALSPQLLPVRIDATALQQVLFNLVLNARDALPRGGHVTISTERKQVKAVARTRRQPDLPAGNYTVLSVIDNGTGMDEAIQARIFEPFFTTKPEGQGTGLGLAQVQGVVQQSNGHIRVYSAPDMGSRFDIYLPEVNQVTDASQSVLTTASPTRGREAILVIEQDDVLRKMIAGILTAEGYSVTAAAAFGDVSGALTSLDLLVVDQNGGATEVAIDRLAKDHPALCVLGTQAHAVVRPVHGRRKQMLEAHLARPFTLNTLLKAIRSLLDQKKS
ncbi:MAG TPA: ATP-binding protein [Opitutaceae bacterium]|nr:ATP-binding protein [Opitutaceae bacterium]